MPDLQLLNARTSEDQSKYDTLMNSWPDDKCPFCEHPQIIVSTLEHFYILQNLFPYSTFDRLPVTEHLLVVPKRHVLHMSDLNSQEVLEFAKITATYDSQGYNIYTRSAANTMRSVGHFHTHLIMLQN